MQNPEIIYFVLFAMVWQLAHMPRDRALKTGCVCLLILLALWQPRDPATGKITEFTPAYMVITALAIGFLILRAFVERIKRL